MNNKRGVSDIVVTILLVLLALAAIALVWGFISGYLKGATSGISKSQACMDLGLEPISCDVSGADAVVRYKLASQANLTGLRVLVETAAGGVDPETVGAEFVPAPLQTIVYTTSVASVDAKKFSVAGVIEVEGEEVFCDGTSAIDCK